MIYYMYKTINKINGKYYVGVHKTSNIDDGYLGSGSSLKCAFKKYGIDNFEKSILKYFSSKEEMYEEEKSIVNIDLVSDKMSYNIKIGGEGGFDYLNESGLALRTNSVLSQETKDKISKAKKGISLSEEHKEKISKNNPMYREEVRQKVSAAVKGRKKSEEHKKKLSEATRQHWLKKRGVGVVETQ